MEITPAKLVSLVTALVCVVASLFVTKEVGTGLHIAVILLFPLSLIWFPDLWGERIAGRITREAPAAIVVFSGRIILIGLPLVLYWMARQR